MPELLCQMEEDLNTFLFQHDEKFLTIWLLAIVMGSHLCRLALEHSIKSTC